jgi:outer membrane immunogenic protein
MKKLLFASVTTAAFFGAPAFAADMPTKAPVYKAVAADPLSWAGCYLGGNLGYSWGTGSGTVDDTGGGSTSFKDHLKGGMAGGQLGCNQQTNNFVWGLETDFQASWERAHTNFSLDSNDGINIFDGTDKNTWLGTTRLRGGVVINNLLFYGTGGVAYGHYKLDLIGSGLGTAGGPLDISKTKAGLVFGGGIESPFVNGWNWRIEFLHTQIKFSDTHVMGILDTLNTRVKETDNIIRIGLNYRFGDPWGKSPVVAKY